MNLIGMRTAQGATECVVVPPRIPPGAPPAVDSEGEGEKAWFAVWTRARHEAAVSRQLAGKGLEAFLPTVTRWSRWKDRKKRVDWPLFPGYCFVRIDPARSLPVRACAGVVSMVSFGGQPAPVADVEIAGLRILVDSRLRCDPCPFIREGDRVEVVGGPLRGVVGQLVRKGPRARLVLAVDLIGQAVSVEVDAGDIRAC